VSATTSSRAAAEVGAPQAGSPDPDRFTRERVGELQRARIIAAMTELAHERGVATVTVAHIVECSGVSRRTFYEHFDDRGECLLAAFEHAIQCAEVEVLSACSAAAEDWESRIRVGLQALLGFFDAQPAIASLCVVHALAAGRPLLERRAQVLDTLVAIVRQGARTQRGSTATARRADGSTIAPRRADRRPAASLTAGPRQQILAEGVVGAVLAVIHARLCQADAKPLIGLLNQLMGIIVLPYRGPDAVAYELARPTRRARRTRATASDPLRGLEMRLTYRTARVLLAIAEQPASSSRRVGDAAGINDQGQVSKLLSRLENLGLIRNRAGAVGRGEPNAWTLSAKGRDVEHAIRSRVGG
jgi:AcrR family transcriptional regulator